MKKEDSWFDSHVEMIGWEKSGIDNPKEELKNQLEEKFQEEEQTRVDAYLNALKPVQELAREIKSQLVAPFFRVEGGVIGDCESVTIKISIDEEDTWANGILHNSNYAIFQIRRGYIEMISKNHNLPKMRKTRIKVLNSDLNEMSLGDTAKVVADKINKWVRQTTAECLLWNM